MKKTALIICTALFIATLSAGISHAARKGANITIRYGTVEKVEEVQFQSEAGKGALVGGAIGLATASGKSTSKKWRNSIIGAMAGGAAKAASEGDLKGVAYTVKATDGAFVRIVTDQTEIRQGDCVVVEQAGNNANIRRVDSTMCEKGSEQAVNELVEELQEEAQECVSAKQQLLEAETEEQIDLALRKVKILCND